MNLPCLIHTCFLKIKHCIIFASSLFYVRLSIFELFYRDSKALNPTLMKNKSLKCTCINIHIYIYKYIYYVRSVTSPQAKEVELVKNYLKSLLYNSTINPR